MNLLTEVPQAALSSALTDLRCSARGACTAAFTASRALRLDHNIIKALPNFEALSGLRSLRMQHNAIAAFDPSMSALVQLREMDLSQASVLAHQPAAALWACCCLPHILLRTPSGTFLATSQRCLRL